MSRGLEAGSASPALPWAPLLFTWRGRYFIFMGSKVTALGMDRSENSLASDARVPQVALLWRGSAHFPSWTVSRHSARAPP